MRAHVGDARGCANGAVAVWRAAGFAAVADLYAARELGHNYAIERTCEVRMWDKVERAAQGVLAFVGGGWAMLWYLDATLSPSVNQIHRLLMIAPTFCMPIMIIVSFVQWKVRKPLKEPIEPSAARSGASVIIMVGLAAAISTYGGVNTAQDLYLPALILFATVVVTVLVIRFAHRNEGNIGEARFRTMPRK